MSQRDFDTAPVSLTTEYSLGMFDISIKKRFVAHSFTLVSLTASAKIVNVLNSCRPPNFFLRNVRSRIIRKIRFFQGWQLPLVAIVTMSRDSGIAEEAISRDSGSFQKSKSSAKWSELLAVILRNPLCIRYLGIEFVSGPKNTDLHGLID